MDVLILMTSHFKPSGHNHLQDIRPYLYLLNKPKIPGHCGFPLTNLQKGPIRDVVPQSNFYNNL
jgi:hypothetical protein